MLSLEDNACSLSVHIMRVLFSFFHQHLPALLLFMRKFRKKKEKNNYELESNEWK